MPLPQRPMLKSDPQARRDGADARHCGAHARRPGTGRSRARFARAPNSKRTSATILPLSPFYLYVYIWQIYEMCPVMRCRLRCVIADRDSVSQLPLVPNMALLRAARRRREIADRTTITNTGIQDRRPFHNSTPYVRKQEACDLR